MKFLHNVSFFRDSMEITPESLVVGEIYHVLGTDNQTYEMVEKEAKVISLNHMKQLMIGDEVFGFSPQKFKKFVKIELKAFIYEKSKLPVTPEEASKLVPENLVYAQGIVQDETGKKMIMTSRVLTICCNQNKVLFFETLNTVYQCEWVKAIHESRGNNPGFQS